MRNPAITLRLKPALLKQLISEAKEQEQTPQQIIRKLLKAHYTKRAPASDPFLDRFSSPTAYSRAHPAREYIDRFSRPRTTAEKRKQHKWWN
ncbi:MAG: hypothetical protein Q7K43_03705 [Candidatus Woesearchaeota archaeon]|nr:hypothetical protein [Candidatus Woesearchaeota archaeon]